MSINVTKNLLNIVGKEISKRDKGFYEGNFAETALIEYLFRYWLESALGSDGFKEIRREVPYTKGREDGQRKACDLVALKNNKTHWIELKVAYENTGYTHAELIADIERLSAVPKKDGRIYVVVFIASSSDIPKKLEAIHLVAEEVGAEVFHKSIKIAVPKNWPASWSDANLHVTSCSW